MGKRIAGTVRGFASVGHYIQGAGVIGQLPEIAAELGSTAVILIDVFFYETLKEELQKEFTEKAPHVEVRFFCAETECSLASIEAFLTSCRESFPHGEIPQVMVGIGGGKTMDTVRGAVRQTGAGLIEVPTSASTNAATSCLAVIYDEEHVGRAVFLKKNPDYVLVDTQILASAPARMLAAGIGDALATYYEARSCWSYNNVNYVRGGLRPTIAGKVAAKACLDTLLLNGTEAYHAVKHHLRTEALEDTVEAIMLLSGLGWENNGTAFAHGLVEGVPTIPDTSHRLHGECVAFCVLVQLILDRESKEDFEKIYDFCRGLGLPTCLADLGITENREEKVRHMIARAFEIDPGITIADYTIDQDMVYQAIFYLDSLQA